MTFGMVVSFVVDIVTSGIVIVRTTPALVPIQRRSLHASRAVTRRQAALCCLIMSSQPVDHSKKGVKHPTGRRRRRRKNF